MIPALVSGTLWDIPTNKALDGLRTTIVNAIWGKSRKQRCREVLLSVLNDPTKTDPLAAIVSRRLNDARRLMNKSQQRYFLARHVYEMSKDNFQQGEIYNKEKGPVRGMVQAASLLGGTLELTDSGFQVHFRGLQPTLNINSGSNATWKANLKASITLAITRQLSARLVDPEKDDEYAEKRGKRKDLYGIGPAIDCYATMVNLDGRAHALTKQYEELWADAGVDRNLGKYRYEEIDRQRLQAVIAGSLRGPDRLHKAGLVKDPSCPFCRKPRANLQHLIWECSAWEAVRSPYIQLIRNYCDKISPLHGGQARVDEINRLMALPCVRNCGVLPEASYFKEGGPPIPPQRRGFARQNGGEGELTNREKDALQRDEEGRIVAFTDGSAIHPTDRRRRRAAWAAFFAPDHPWNINGPVSTDLQTVHTAELMAVAHVFASATAPTRVVSDCRGVVDIVRAELNGEPAPTGGDHDDLRQTIREAIKSRPHGFFAVEWVTSHIPLDRAADIERSGSFLERYIQGNCQADLLAKSGISWHDIDHLEYKKADDREFLACVIQTMIEEVWKNVFDQDVNMRGLEDHSKEDEDQDEQPTEQEPTTTYDQEMGGGHCNPIALPNRKLAEFIRRVAPRYDWGEGRADLAYDEISLPSLPCYARLQKRASQLVPGRGMVNISFNYPGYYAEAVRWWWNRLRWPVEAVRGEANGAATTVSYLEGVIDFELSTGFRLGLDGACGSTWAEKARVLAYIVKALARIHTITINGARTTLQKALRPRGDVPSLTPLGAPVTSGYGRRPKWVSDKTPQVVAYNVWRAREAERRTRTLAGHATKPNARNRMFAKNWAINYAGFPADDGWIPQANAALKEKIAKRAHGDRGGCEPCAPPHPASGAKRGTAGSAREHQGRDGPPYDNLRGGADEDGDVPLPSMTREQKMARMNMPDSQGAADQREAFGGHSSSSTIAPTAATTTDTAEHHERDDGIVMISRTCGTTTASSSTATASSTTMATSSASTLPTAPIPVNPLEMRDRKRARRDGQGPQGRATPPSAEASTSPASGTLTRTSGASAMKHKEIISPPHLPHHRSKRIRTSASTSSATASITEDAKTPFTDQDQIQCIGKPACGGRGGQLSTSQKRARMIPPTLKVPCAACGDTYDVDARWRYLTNAPYRTLSWRGARPGSRVCIPCHGEFMHETDGKST